ncbi:exonuclease SbcCD subunit D [Marinilactibacillus psychrotolerans]|uniref:Nuclease SbcCD subunit D n=1 Tax=Marinilactibacillus psychrotolerans TaxID=191770 RepID=A0AAV3WSE1_9LACT|nr:exonuclease SbcCD subunit D [Marinilactibacillus psychrotolerans]GEL67010.1 nuclease SbcCD subunit D [Marinilactibacillus psychrotolerans]GEQ36155.1 exonuclease SbcD [Marinilactibacillus psychrotolerans]SDC75971.1 Exodeoxyribonuclease I subunit D [Marinilactibacillus psychrotolerans]
MRILHTADWHIGKIVNEFSMLEDQEYYLNQLVDKVKELNIDVLIMAGDLYDRAIPPKEAVTLANKIITRLIKEAGIPVLAIAGNHDSNERLEYAAELLETSNLFIEGMVKKITRKVTINGVNFYLLPFSDHITVRQLLEQDDIKDLEDATKAQIELMKASMNLEETNILIAHGYIVNQTKESVEDSDSERPLSIGTAEFVDASLFEDFDYVALGHLHKAQKVKWEKIRYSGSPLKYSKSEVPHKKKSWVVEIEKDKLEVEPIQIEPLRDMQVLRGTFEELMKSESNHYTFFELEDKDYVMDAMNQLRRRYPFAMGLEYIGRERNASKTAKQTQETLQKKSMVELFEDFYATYKLDTMDKNQKSAVEQVMNEVQKGES